MSADVKLPLIDLEGSDMPTGRKVDDQRERLSEEGVEYCVYWAHTPNHSDPCSEGYIGITKNLSERIRSHKRNKKKSIFSDAAKSYGWENLIVEVMHENLLLEEALSYERNYRPREFIGWNQQIGGELGVGSSWYHHLENQQAHKMATSVATKIAIAKNDTAQARSERAKVSWSKTREKRIKSLTGENNPRAILSADQVRDIKYTRIPSGESDVAIAEVYKVKPYVISFIRSGKNWKSV